MLLLERARRHPSASRLALAFDRHEAYFAFLAGDVEAALEQLDEATTASREPANPWSVALAHASLARMLGEIGRTADSLAAWEDTVTFADQHALMHLVREAHLGTALVELRAGRIAEAEIATARADAIGRGEPRTAAIVTALLAAARGRATAAGLAATRALARARRGDAATRAETLWWLIPALLVGDTDAARAEVADVAHVCDANFPGEHGRHVRARLLMMDAVLLATSAGVEPARAQFRRACDLAGPNLIHVLRPLWPHVSALVADATSHSGSRPSEDLGADELLRVLSQVREDGQAVLDVMCESSDRDFRVRAAVYLVRTGHPSSAALVGGDLAPAVHSAMSELPADPPVLRFSVLGHFALHRGPWEVTDVAWRRPIAPRLVRLLLAHRERAIPEDEIFEALWPNRSADVARRALHVATSQARAVLDVPGAQTSAIRRSERTYRLTLAPGDTVDADEFFQLAETALT
jgi:hypothetical protein